MSADDVKARLPALALQTAKRKKLVEHLDRNEFKAAFALKEELDGRQPRGQVVRIFSGRRLHIVARRFDEGFK